VTLRDHARRGCANRRQAATETLRPRCIEETFGISRVDRDRVLRHLDHQIAIAHWSRRDDDARRVDAFHDAGRCDHGACHRGDQRLFVQVEGRVPVGDVHHDLDAAQTSIRGKAVTNARQHRADEARPELPTMRLVDDGRGAHLPRGAPRRGSNEIQRHTPDER